jgi:hypothetical protein
MFGLRLNSRKFVKNPIELIRCKFSIDAGFPAMERVGRPHPPFRNHTGRVLETGRSPSESNERPASCENPGEAAVFDGEAARLSVSLIST